MKFKIDPNWFRTPIKNSSQIKEIAYDNMEHRLYVVFTNQSVYAYEEVSYLEYIEFRESESVGRYFHTHIKLKKTTKQSNG